MLTHKQPLEETLQCAEHGAHARDSFPASRTITKEQLRTWLASSRRIYVSWNMDTGLRQERLAPTTLDPDKARSYATTLWLRYCCEPPTSLATIEEQTGIARDKVRPTLRVGLNHLRDAFRAPYGSVPDQLQPGTQLSVALFGCGHAIQNTGASFASSERSSSEPASAAILCAFPSEA
jgi:hypothetical protein